MGKVIRPASPSGGRVLPKVKFTSVAWGGQDGGLDVLLEGPRR